MRIKVYSLCRSGHHAISFWLAKNIVPAAAVDLVYDSGSTTVKLMDNTREHVLDIQENDHLKIGDQPAIIIIRDPFNNYASYLKLCDNPNFTTLSFFPFLQYWKEYAREAVGETNFLKNKVVISYNDWVDSQDYRKDVVAEIGKKFGIETKFDDSLKTNMTKFGGGSSFDGLMFIKDADKMKVHERFKFYESSARYRAAVDTQEIRELSDKIFRYYPWKTVEKSPDRDMWQTMNDILG